MQETTNLFESLYDSIVFDSRDWGVDKSSAWVYGIIIGWNGDTEDENEDLFKEFNKKFGWDKCTWNRLKLLHKEYEKMSKK